MSTLGLAVCGFILFSLAVIAWKLSKHIGPFGFVTSHLLTFVSWQLILSAIVWTGNGSGEAGFLVHAIALALLNILLLPISLTALLWNAVQQ